MVGQLLGRDGVEEGEHLAGGQAWRGLGEADRGRIAPRSTPLLLPPPIVAAIARDDGPPLFGRPPQAHLVQGRSDRAIAEALFIIPHTATTRVKRVLRKLDVDSRAAAAAWAGRHRLV